MTDVTSPSGFNPRPRTGGDGLRSPLRHEPIVSIRAPARGATISTANR